MEQRAKSVCSGPQSTSISPLPLHGSLNRRGNTGCTENDPRLQNIVSGELYRMVSAGGSSCTVKTLINSKTHKLRFI